MSVQETLKRYTIEYVAGKRKLSECSVPEIKWAPLRRVLIATKRYHEGRDGKTGPRSSRALEKKRAESKFWLETGIKWPVYDSEL